MKQLLNAFRAEEAGNTFTDWFCFTAGAVLLSSALVATAFADRTPELRAASIAVEEADAAL